ncbi:MAG: hypothetical protein ACLP0J_24975 [Solirubrobacteraceae bacterium]|jgi:hypothetical protein
MPRNTAAAAAQLLGGALGLGDTATDLLVITFPVVPLGVGLPWSTGKPHATPRR